MKTDICTFLLFLACTTAISAAQPKRHNEAPEGVDPKMTSTDPDYGYSEGKPIMVGSPDEHGGPASERAYLDLLRDENGEKISYKRLGSYGEGPDGHIIDGYEITTSTGRSLVLFIDMYHPRHDPKKRLAPAGLFKVK